MLRKALTLSLCVFRQWSVDGVNHTISADALEKFGDSLQKFRDTGRMVRYLNLNHPYKDEGLCRIAERFGLYLHYRIFSKWRHFSGESGYPVPSMMAALTPSQAFHRLPKWQGPQGAKRESLHEFLVARMQDDYDLIKAYHKARGIQ